MPAAARYRAGKVAPWCGVVAVIFITVGLPGRFAEWCAGVLAKLAVSLGGSVVVREWPTVEELLGYRSLGRVLDQIALSLLQDAPAQLVVGARQPDERLCRALAETAAPFILALDDPRLAAADILSQTAVEPAAATRMMANSCPFVMRCTALPGALRLHANDARRDRAGAVATIARHFGLPIDKTRAGRLVRQLAGAGLTPGEAGAFDKLALLDERSRKMIDGALGAYGGVFTGDSLREIVWNRELFAIVGDPERKPTEPIDVSGGARCLVYGPYIHLAPGSWSARVVLGFSSDAIGHVFLVDACCGDRQLAAVNFQPKVAGMHVVQVNFSVADEMGQGVEIRVMVIGDHAQGRVAFGQASLMPLELTDSSTGDAMEVVLGL
jgi:hypothetical protein